jgi:hypothetical protein
MRLSTIDFRFLVLTPCFSGTAEGKEASYSELRVPPIRGHVRFWHGAAFGHVSASQVWGSTTGNEGQGSRVAVRITSGIPPSRHLAQLLPHKTHGQGPRPALPPGSSATIQLQRLPACTSDDWMKASSAAKLWLLAGTLGYRASRAAGSIWPEQDWTPRNRGDLADSLAPLIRKSNNPWAAALVGEGASADWELLRNAASNTPKGPTDVFGNAQPRTPSVVRFKVIQSAGALCLLALAPSRTILLRAEQAIAGKVDRRFWEELGPWKHL